MRKNSFSRQKSNYLFHKLEMNPEKKIFEFLGSCGILLKEQAQITNPPPKKKEQQSKQLANIKKWHSLADRCINLWNEYNAGYSFRSGRAFCPLREPIVNTVSLRKFDRRGCLEDNAVVNLKRVPRNFKGTSCTTKKRQTENVESILRLPKNANFLLGLGGPWSYECINECCRSLSGSVCFHMHLTNFIRLSGCLYSFAVFATFRANNPWF